MTDTTTGPLRPGYRSLAIYFSVPDCAKAIEFYQQAFGAELCYRMDGPDGSVLHAEMQVGDSRFALSDPMPGYGIVGPPADGNAFTVTYWTAQVDEVFQRAVAAGARVLRPVTDAFSGDRMGVLRCPYGVRWCVARHDRDVPNEEIEAAARAWSESRDVDADAAA